MEGRNKKILERKEMMERGRVWGGQLEEMDEGSSEMERRNEKESEAKLGRMEKRDRNRWKGKKE